MTLIQKLLLFAGIPAAGASAAVPIVISYQKSEKAVEGFREDEDIGIISIEGIEVGTQKEDEQAKILKKAGFFCGLLPKDGETCLIYKKGFRLKEGNNVEEGLKISSSSTGKFILRKSNPYSYGLRLAVEGGDIFLEGESKTPKKLERFESFGLEEQGKEGGEKELHLVKKETHQKGVMRTLGLPANCELPLDGNTKPCTLSSEQIKSVHFEGRKEKGATVPNSQNITLNISKSVDSNLFKESYRFAFSSSGAEITINNGNVIRDNASTEFTVKEWKDEDMVLVRAGSGEKEAEFFSKVGLKCDSSNNVCTIEGGKLNVIKGDSSKESDRLSGGKKTGGEKGIIKLYREQANYINGLKFSIEGEDILISGDQANSSVNRLSLLDGYEIVETGKKFYLKRKDSGLASIVKRLGIMENPSGNVENSTEPVFSTTVSTSHSQNIKFYVENKAEKTNDNKSIEVKGYRTTDTDTYKYGYRFSLKPTGGDVNIGKTKLKNGVSVDFKIREEAGELYLERAIAPEKLIEMVGLSCAKEGGEGSTETCTFKEGKANVRHWNGNIKGANAATQEGVGKLKLTRDQADYTDGFMFTVHDGDITFTGGTEEKEKIKMSEFEKYEIKEENGTWFLNQKTNFMQEKYSALGIEQKCNNQFHGVCEMEGMYVANNVKFKAGKDKTTKGQFSSGAKVKFQMAKNVMYPFGIKVDMWVDGGDNNRHVSVVCKESESPTLLKLTKDKTEFKIEKIDNNFYLAKTTGETNETCNAPAAK